VKTRLLLLVAALLSAGPLAAQPMRPPQRPDAPREEIFRMIDAYVVSNMQESLGLSDEQFVKLLPLVKRLQTDRRGMAERRLRAMNELRRALNSGSATDAQVAELMKEVRAVENDEPAAIRKHVEAIDAALTPLQQAKFRVLETEVERRLREMMAQVRKNAEKARQRREDQRP
jgi:hypothetical protein